MKLKLIFISIYIVISLSGCEALNQMQADDALKRLNVAQESCIKYGFKKSTDSFAHCVQTEINEIKNRTNVELRAARAAVE